MRLLLAGMAFLASAQAQWILQESHTTASLRGIHNVGRGVAWASGANGAILRTTNDGAAWQTCPIPPDAEKLDFRGIQGFSESSAIAMSSGKGDLSRLYKTTDACRTWKLVFTNPDPEGFWDALRFSGAKFGVLIGDPVRGRFPLFLTRDGGDSWQRADPKVLPPANASQSLFAASNSALLLNGTSGKVWFVTGGGATAFITVNVQASRVAMADLPLAVSASGGGFSLASHKGVIVAVGGDYKEPDNVQGTAAWLKAGSWHTAASPPQGYRSTLDYDAPARVWIAAGPNGTDISRNDGRTWIALKPIAGDTPDSGRNWNAISLPFVVGSTGRLGKIRREALHPE